MKCFIYVCFLVFCFSLSLSSCLTTIKAEKLDFKSTFGKGTLSVSDSTKSFIMYDGTNVTTRNR